MSAFQFHTWQDLKSQQLARSETSKPSKAKLLKDKESENISGNVHFLKNILYLMDSDCIHWIVHHHFFSQDAESRAEYGEMNVQRIHLQIDQLEDELIGQKQKCKAINDELQQTFNDMVQNY